MLSPSPHYTEQCWPECLQSFCLSSHTKYSQQCPFLLCFHRARCFCAARISAEPCERVKEEGTRGTRGKRKDCHGVLAVGNGALTGAVQDESQQCRKASKWKV